MKGLRVQTALALLGISYGTIFVMRFVNNFFVLHDGSSFFAGIGLFLGIASILIFIALFLLLHLIKPLRVIAEAENIGSLEAERNTLIPRALRSTSKNNPL